MDSRTAARLPPATAAASEDNGAGSGTWDIPGKYVYKPTLNRQASRHDVACGGGEKQRLRGPSRVVKRRLDKQRSCYAYSRTDIVP